MGLNSLEQDIKIVDRNLLLFSGIFFDNEKEKYKFSKFIAENKLISGGVIDKNFHMDFFLESYFHYKFYKYWTKKEDYSKSIEMAEKYFSFHKLLTIFAPAYENIENLDKQIKEVENKIGNISGDISGFEKLCNFYFNDLQEYFLKKPNKTVVQKNIEKVNNEQLKKLGLDLEIKNRKLILYYRYRHEFELVDVFEFSVIYWILKKYIKGGYSPLFNDLLIVSRQENLYPYKIIKQIDPNYKYIWAMKEDFKKLNIGGNFLHLGVANAKESEEYYSIPIINNTIDLLEEKKPKNYIKGDFGYTWDDPISIQDSRFKRIYGKEGNIKSLMEEIIKSIKSLEDKMLVEKN